MNNNNNTYTTQSQSYSFEVDLPKSNVKPSVSTRLENNEIPQSNMLGIQTRLDEADKRREAEIELVL